MHCRAASDQYVSLPPIFVFQLHERLVPAALLSRSNPSDPNQMEAIMTPQLTGRQRDTMKSLQRKALVSWWETGHPGWRIWERDTETFMRSVHTPSVSSPWHSCLPGLLLHTYPRLGCNGSAAHVLHSQATRSQNAS